MVNNDTVIRSQFDIRKSCNTSAVLELFCDADNCIENRSYLIAVFVNFSKTAFVMNDVLVRKFECIDIIGNALKWLASYLSNSKQCVQLKKNINQMIL